MKRKKIKKNIINFNETRINNHNDTISFEWHKNIYQKNKKKKVRSFFLAPFLSENFQCYLEKKKLKKFFKYKKKKIRYQNSRLFKKKNIYERYLKKYNNIGVIQRNNCWKIKKYIFRNKFCYDSYKKKHYFDNSNFINYNKKKLINENILKNFININGEKDFYFKNKKIKIYRRENKIKNIRKKKSYFKKNYKNKIKKNIFIKKKIVHYFGTPNMYKKTNNSKRRKKIIFENPKEMPKLLFFRRQIYDNRSYRYMRKGYKNSHSWTKMVSAFYSILRDLQMTQKEKSKKKYKYYDRWLIKKKPRKKVIRREKKQKYLDKDPNSLKNQLTKKIKNYKPIKYLANYRWIWKSRYWYRIMILYNKKKFKKKQRNYKSWTQFSKLHINVQKDALINKAKGIISYSKTIKAITHCRKIVKPKAQKKRYKLFIKKYAKRIIFFNIFFAIYNKNK